MFSLRFVVLVALVSALAGCADGPDRVIYGHPPPARDRANGQPRLLPCMIGDALCGPS